MKKFSWILALLTALAMVFIACPSDSGGGDGGLPVPEGNPIVDGAKYLQALNRTNSWDGFDIKTNKGGNLANYTANKKHTFTVIGWANPGTVVMYTLTDKPYGNYEPKVEADADVDGIFELTREFTWAEISGTDSIFEGGESNNIRLGIPTAAKTVYIYEVIIKDEDGVIKYQMSAEGSDVQGIPHGTLINDDFEGLVFLQRSGGATITVLDPKSAGAYVAVSEIPGVPSAGKTNKAITLPTEANPPVATNKTVTWSIKEQGGTSSTLAGNVLTAIAPGTVTVTGTVVNGATATTNFTQDYSIEITAPAELGGNKVVMNFGAEPIDITLTATGGLVDYFADGTGYQFQHTADWQGAWTKFAVTLPSGKKLSDYNKVTFDIEPIFEGGSPTTGITEEQYIGRIQYKNVGLLAAATVTVGSSEPLGIQITDYPQLPLRVTDGKQSATLSFTPKGVRGVSELTTLELSIYLHGRIDTIYQFSNIVFVEGVIPNCELCGAMPCGCIDACNCSCSGCTPNGNCGAAGSRTCDVGCACDCHGYDTYWSTASTADIDLAMEISDTAVVGVGTKITPTIDGTDLVFTIAASSAGSVGIIAIPTADIARLDAAAANKGTLKVTITGTSSSTTATYRACLGYVGSSTNWNGTSWIGGEGAFTGIAGEKTITFTGNATSMITNPDNPGSRLQYLIIQARNAEASVVTIESVKIEIVPYP